MVTRDQRLETDALVIWKERLYEVTGYEKAGYSMAGKRDTKLWVRDVGSSKERCLTGAEILDVELFRASPYTELRDVDRKEPPKS